MSPNAQIDGINCKTVAPQSDIPRHIQCSANVVWAVCNLGEIDGIYAFKHHQI